MTVLKPKSPSNYELHERLGEGLSSEVVAATKRDGDGLSEQSVVLKILKSQTAVSWLQKEFAALRSVDSNYCVRVLGWESFDQGPALVLERIDGVTLHDLGRRFHLNESEIDEIAYQVEQGLRDLHDVSVIHGDLSPKNILISRDGDVKLIDFGAIGAAADLIGTPAYIAHSRWLGKAASSESDFASWTLIAHDLRTRFQTVPVNNDSARLRAADFASQSETPVRASSFTDDRAQLGRKVEMLMSEKVRRESTAVLETNKCDENTGSQRASWQSRAQKIAIVLLLVISTPVFSDPEPLRAALGGLRISTMKWVEVRIDEGPTRFAPFKAKIGAGRHRLQWRSQHGSGEFSVLVAADQMKTLDDANFKR